MEEHAAAAALAVEWSQAPPAEWEDWLPRAVGASFAARSGWMEALARLQPSARSAVLCVRRGGRLAGAVPLWITRRLGLTRVSSMPFGTYGGPLLDAADPDPPAVRAALGRALAAWLERERVVAGEVTHAPLAIGARPDSAWEGLAHTVTGGQAHIVDLSAGTVTILDGLRRQTRWGLRHAQRAGVKVGERPELLDEIHALYVTQAIAWPGHQPYPLAFLRALLEHPSRFARLYVASRHGQPEAGILALSGGGETFLWWSGAAPASRESLSYPYLIVSILEQEAASGQKRLNLGGSGGRERLHRFKHSLGGQPRPFFTYHLRPRRTDWWLSLSTVLRRAGRLASRGSLRRANDGGASRPGGPPPSSLAHHLLTT